MALTLTYYYYMTWNRGRPCGPPRLKVDYRFFLYVFLIRCRIFLSHSLERSQTSPQGGRIPKGEAFYSPSCKAQRVFKEQTARPRGLVIYHNRSWFVNNCGDFNIPIFFQNFLNPGSTRFALAGKKYESEAIITQKFFLCNYLKYFWGIF